MTFSSIFILKKLKLKNQKAINRLAKILSEAFNPICSFLIYIGYISYFDPKTKDSVSLLPILLIIVIPLVLWIIFKIKTGDYANHDVSDRQQRKTLYLFLDVSLISFLMYDYFANQRVHSIILFLFVLLVALQISNYAIKSSMHVALNLFVAILFFSENQKIGISWLVLTVLIAISRLILKKHTPKEVLSGFVISLIISGCWYYFN